MKILIKDCSGIEVEINEGSDAVELTEQDFDVVGKTLCFEWSAGVYKTRKVCIPISQISGMDDPLWGVRLYVPYWLAKSKRIV